MRPQEVRGAQAPIRCIEGRLVGECATLGEKRNVAGLKVETCRVSLDEHRRSAGLDQGIDDRKMALVAGQRGIELFFDIR
ncbi:hypothetical protein D3C87_2010200 [compost metagenome]